MQKVAIVGFGFMGQIHAQVYAQLANAEVGSVVDTRLEEGKAALSKLGLDAPVHENLSSLLDSAEIDAVDVCLPTDLHHPVVLEAIGAGKHVFCEKPISTSTTKAEEMVHAARDAGVELMVGHCIRFWPEYLAITEAVAASRAGREVAGANGSSIALGKLVSLNLQRFGGRPSYTIDSWIDDEERCHGAALDMHIHDTDYLLHLLGKPDAVFSRGVREKAGWNYISSNFVYPDGPVVSTEGGWLLPPKWGFRMTLKAVFEHAAIDFDNTRDPTLTLTLGDEAPAPMPYPRIAAATGAESDGNISDLGGYYNELEYFVARLEGGKPIETNTGAQALESLRTALAEIESAATGKVVSLT